MVHAHHNGRDSIILHTRVLSTRHRYRAEWWVRASVRCPRPSPLKIKGRPGRSELGSAKASHLPLCEFDGLAQELRLLRRATYEQRSPPRTNEKMVRIHKRQSGIRGGQWADNCRVVSFATRGRAVALSSLPTPVRNHHHLESHTSETHTNMFAKGSTRRLRSSALSTSPSVMVTSVVS